ncbi:MAG: hypothetical protein AB7E77_05525 [Desulfobulbus sp.]
MIIIATDQTAEPATMDFWGRANPLQMQLDLGFGDKKTQHLAERHRIALKFPSKHTAVLNKSELNFSNRLATSVSGHDESAIMQRIFGKRQCILLESSMKRWFLHPVLHGYRLPPGLACDWQVFFDKKMI